MSAHGGPADWWTEGTDVGRTHVATKGVVQNGLVLNLDAGVNASYPDSGTVWTDLSGNTNNGTLVNGTGYSAGNGGSLTFDGSNDFGTVDSFLVGENSAISIFTWVYALNLSVQQSGGNYLNWIANQRNITSPNANSWQLFVANSFPTISFWDSSSALITSSTSSIISNSTNIMELNTWYYVGATTSGVNGSNFTIYLNDSVNYEEQLIGNVSLAMKPLDIGKIGWGLGYYWNGNIAQLSIYNRALTQQEVTQNFNATRDRYGI
jgi:hypothetical protein